MSMTTIKTNEFATRHTAKSPFSHFEGTWEQLEALVTAHFDKAAPGYRDGVLLVPVPADGFFSPTVALEEGMALHSEFKARREGEAPFVQTTVQAGSKTPARGALVVIYRRDVLQEDDGASTDADWEIVSIQARVTEEEEPMHPFTMARNFLQMEGGTKGEFSAEDFAKAILFHFTHGQVASDS